MTLDELVTQLKAAHGDALLGVVLYGSTAADSGAAQTRGHNVLVVVRTLDVTAMHAVPLTLTEAEWRSSVDVFAIEHADIAERHRVLHAAPGFGVADRSSIRDDDVRRQLEDEALALTLAVRSAITSVGRDTRDRRALLASQASRAVALLRAAVRLSGAVPAPDAEALCAQAATLAGFDAAPFVAALRQRRGTNKVPKGELDSVLDGFHTGLTRFVAYLDGRSTPR